MDRKALWAWRYMRSAMISKKAICLLFISVVLTATLGCLAQDKAASNSATDLIKYIPQGNKIPSGFEYILIENNMQEDTAQNIFKSNMTDEILGFYGNKTITPVNFALGRYRQPDYSGDGKVTIIEMNDETSAQNAVSNYMANFQTENPFKLSGNVSLIGTATVNGHDVTEIKVPEYAEGGYIVKYDYLWANKNLLILTEGNPDRSKSMELASATGL
jgi:hypothetical protein